jgi:L-rhamnose mutarotase
MNRLGFKMKLKDGFLVEYKRRHDEIRPELKKLLHESGIYDYVIYLDEDTHLLFGSLKLKDHNTYSNLSAEPVMKKWWAYMKDIMETNPDSSPVSIPLKEMFYMD